MDVLCEPRPRDQQLRRAGQKNSPIMEFSPANISYKNVTSTGFRTFIKLKGGSGDL
ncbi:hypothetical protein ACFSQ7_48950 [Paenibacillus rhizoplanae]